MVGKRRSEHVKGAIIDEGLLVTDLTTEKKEAKKNR